MSKRGLDALVEGGWRKFLRAVHSLFSFPGVFQKPDQAFVNGFFILSIDLDANTIGHTGGRSRFLVGRKHNTNTNKTRCNRTTKTRSII